MELKKQYSDAQTLGAQYRIAETAASQANTVDCTTLVHLSSNSLSHTHTQKLLLLILIDKEAAGSATTKKKPSKWAR